MIKDLKTVTSSINVTGGALSIHDVNVQVNISHTRVNDLNIFLIAPDGTRIELSTNNGATGDHYTNTVFDDEASVSIFAGTAPFQGSYLPEGWLGDLDGKNANGTWKLEISDAVKTNSGKLLDWSLTINGAHSLAPPSLPTLDAAFASLDLQSASEELWGHKSRRR